MRVVRGWRVVLALLAGVAMFAAQGAPESWPVGPVRFVVPFAPGGATDAMARLLGEHLQEVWQQPVIIDNKPGAGTILGTDAVAKAYPDGHTFGWVVSAHAINAARAPQMPYDALDDFVPVSLVAEQHMGLFAHPDFAADTVAELIGLARAEPGRITYASPGVGTALHLAAEWFKAQTGTDLMHVAYRGGSPAQQDVVGGQVPLLVDIYHSAAAMVDAGRLKPIALFSQQRSPDLPGVPVMAETVAGVSAMSVIGVVAPAGTSPEVVNRISADIAAALRTPALRERMKPMGVVPIGSTSAEFDARLRQDIEKWRKVLGALGVRID